MTEREERENQIRLEALEAKLDGLVSNINYLTQVIDGKQPMLETKPFYTITDIARMAGLSKDTVKQDVDNEILKVVHRGKKKVVTQKAASEYLNQ